MSRRSSRRGPSVVRRVLEWTLVLVLGALLGSACAALLEPFVGSGPILSFVTRTWEIGLREPLTIDLVVLGFTLGATVRVGALTAVFTAVAAGLYVKTR